MNRLALFALLQGNTWSSFEIYRKSKSPFCNKRPNLPCCDRRKLDFHFAIGIQLVGCRITQRYIAYSPNDSDTYQVNMMSCLTPLRYPVFFQSTPVFPFSDRLSDMSRKLRHFSFDYISSMGCRVGAISWDSDRSIGDFQYDPKFFSAEIEISPIAMPARESPPICFQH